MNGLHFHSQAAYAESRPSWDSLAELSEAMVKKNYPVRILTGKEKKKEHTMTWYLRTLLFANSIAYSTFSHLTQ